MSEKWGYSYCWGKAKLMPLMPRLWVRRTSATALSTSHMGTMARVMKRPGKGSAYSSIWKSLKAWMASRR